MALPYDPLFDLIKGLERAVPPNASPTAADHGRDLYALQMFVSGVLYGDDDGLTAEQREQRDQLRKQQPWYQDFTALMDRWARLGKRQSEQ